MLNSIFFFVYRIVIVQRKNALTVKSLKTDFLYVEFWIMIRFRHGHNIIASSNNRPGNGSNVHANSCEEFQYPISGTESRFLPVIHFTLNPLFIQRSKSIGIYCAYIAFFLSTNVSSFSIADNRNIERSSDYQGSK